MARRFPPGNPARGSPSPSPEVDAPADAGVTRLPHTVPAAAVAAGLDVAPERGLLSTEAAARLGRYGPNALETKGPPGFWMLLVRQFMSPLIAMLVLAAGISLVAGDPQDAVVIGLVLVLNALIGAVQ